MAYIFINHIFIYLKKKFPDVRVAMHIEKTMRVIKLLLRVLRADNFELRDLKFRFMHDTHSASLILVHLLANKKDKWCIMRIKHEMERTSTRDYPIAQNLSSFCSGNSGTETRVLNVDNATFTFPSSPLLTQGGDVSPGMLCTNRDDNEDDLSESNETVSRRRCRAVSDVGAGDICECVHVRHVPLGATVEIILLDQGN